MVWHGMMNQSSMRIGIDARMYGSKVTGIGTYVRHLTDALFSLQADDEFVLFMQRRDATQVEPPSGKVKIVAVNMPWYSWREQLQMHRSIRREQCDVVHFPNFNFPLAYRGKFILTVHDLTPLEFPGPNQQRYWWRRMAYIQALKAGFGRAAAIIAVSRHTAEEITRFYPPCDARVNIIYPGLSPAFHENLKYDTLEHTVARYGIRQPYLMYVGVWRDHKNIPGLLDAFVWLRQRLPKLQLVLAGDQTGADEKVKPRLQRIASGAVVTPGFIPDHDLPALFASASATVIPSFAEGFGLIGIESLACGTPVAASNTTSLPEVLGPAGRYFSPHDSRAMAEVIGDVLDPRTRQQVLGYAPSVVARYRWSEAARQTLALYREIATHHAP